MSFASEVIPPVFWIILCLQYLIVNEGLLLLLLLLFFFTPHPNTKKNLCVNINMINLSLEELRLIAQNRNIRDYENKSEKDLIKALSEPKPKIRINKNKLEEIRKFF